MTHLLSSIIDSTKLVRVYGNSPGVAYTKTRVIILLSLYCFSVTVKKICSRNIHIYYNCANYVVGLLNKSILRILLLSSGPGEKLGFSQSLSKVSYG